MPTLTGALENFCFLDKWHSFWLRPSLCQKSIPQYFLVPKNFDKSITKFVLKGSRYSCSLKSYTNLNIILLFVLQQMAKITNSVALTKYSRSYSNITSLLRQNYALKYLEFSDNYFDTAVVTIQGSFTREIPTSEIPISWTILKTA